MFDVVAMNAYGCHVGALKNLSKGIEQPLCTAVEDFPKRGIIVSDNFRISIDINSFATILAGGSSCLGLGNGM